MLTTRVMLGPSGIEPIATRHNINAAAATSVYECALNAILAIVAVSVLSSRAKQKLKIHVFETRYDLSRRSEDPRS